MPRKITQFGVDLPCFGGAATRDGTPENIALRKLVDEVEEMVALGIGEGDIEEATAASRARHHPELQEYLALLGFSWVYEAVADEVAKDAA